MITDDQLTLIVRADRHASKRVSPGNRRALAAADVLISRERLTILLLFSFPLFVVSVRHWASGIYILLALLALTSLRHGWHTVHKEERVFVVVLLAYLASALISNSLSGWTNASVRWSQADLRVLSAIPIVVLLSRFPHATVALLRAAPIAAVIAGAYAVYAPADETGRADGPYGPIFLGNVSALLALLSLASMGCATYWPRIRIAIHSAGAALGLVAAVLSGTRSAWLAVVVCLPFAAAAACNNGLKQRRRRVLLGLAVVVIASVGISIMEAPHLAKERVLGAIDEFQAYRTARTQAERDALAITPIAFRLEQWRVGLAIFRERPLFGYGVGNAGKEVNRHVKAGRANRVLYSGHAESGRPSHLHNAYLDALAHKGIVGLLTLLLLLGHPAYVAFRMRSAARTASNLVLVNAAAFVVFSLTEDPFIRNNFTSVYLIFAMSLFALMVHDSSRKQDLVSGAHARTAGYAD